MALRDARPESANFDCVVMLTWSNWHTEMRGNRYHFATRFARLCPVYFVQPDLRKGTLQGEAIPGHPNLTVLHIPSLEDNILSTPLSRFLDAAGHQRPLLWCYNYSFAPFYCTYRPALRAYHASEDYFRMVGPKIPALSQVVAASDLVICVSEGVRQSLESRLGVLPHAHVITNGCDYAFFAQAAEPHEAIRGLPQPRALYQGNVSKKVDFDLLLYTTGALQDVTFVFAGASTFDSGVDESNQRKWNALLARPNVQYLGQLPPQELPALMSGCDVGLIPFVQEDWIVKPGFPLKTFEYLAAGLPVVSTPLDNLQSFRSLVCFASTPDQFVEGIREAVMGADSGVVERRRLAAKGQSYDRKFAQVEALLAHPSLAVQREGVPKRSTLGRVVYHLTTAEPSLYAGFALSSAGSGKAGDETIIGLEVRPEPDRCQPVIEHSNASTIIRRPLVSVPWHSYFAYAREMMACSRSGLGILLGLLITAMAGVSLSVSGFFRAARLLPLSVRRLVKRVLSSGKRVQHGGFPSAENPVSWERRRLGVGDLIQMTHTLVHAVEEAMVTPHVVRSLSPTALLAGVVCKRRFGCHLIYDPRTWAESSRRELAQVPRWVLRGLEGSLIKRADLVVSAGVSSRTGDQNSREAYDET